MWVGFVLAHVWLTRLGSLVLLNQSFGDVDLYRRWMEAGLTQGWWPVLDEAWVYPAGAIVPLLAPTLVAGTAAGGAYVLGWCVLVTALDALAVSALLRRPGGHVAAAWWLAFLVLLGPVAIGRLDSVVAPLSVLALLAALSSPRASAALVTAGAWVKVSPGAAIVPLALAARRPWRDVVAPAAAVCAVVVGTVVALGGGRNVASFVLEQGSRGLQIESVGATPWLVAGLWSPAVQRYLNSELVTYEIAGPGTQGMADVLGAGLVVGVLLASAVLWWCRRRDGAAFWTDDALRGDFVVRGAFLMALVLIVANKVGSPQFMTWLAPPVAVALALRRPWWGRTALVVAGIAAATQVVYPWWYLDVLYGRPAVTLLLAARNVALVVLLVVTVVHLLRPPHAADEARVGRVRVGRARPRATTEVVTGDGPAEGRSEQDPSGAVGGEPGEQVGPRAPVVDRGVG
ncbi:glycosyltransferase 87 family protein [Cellulomonas telluris]|uniref:glycosyltransferase 87 family protein n=1 Tax=Cellulomonas telluris TaxID=2306636 RepID=UPI0010A87282|nr:glycosyltransferase 87 family protein [Cellulomonas telluris]